MSKSILVRLFIVMLLTACHSKKKNDSVAHMNFNVTDSLLGDVINDTTRNFYLKAPKYFDKISISQEQQDKINNAGLKLLYSSQNKSNGAAFVVLDLNKLSDSLFLKYHSLLKSSLENNKKFKKVGIDSFYSNKIFFIQYFALSDSTVNLKLLTSNYLKGRYEIDFSIPSSVYNNQSRTVESVLGSIK